MTHWKTGQKIKTEVKKNKQTEYNCVGHHVRWKTELLQIKNVSNKSDL